MESQATINALLNNIQLVIKGKQHQIQLALSCLIAGGHILLEDNPGTGKTVMARTLAQSINNSVFKRVQFTPDLLPMDLLGTNIYNTHNNSFEFKKGPLFCNILLADEINRASPKVQSALLECMAENQISIGDNTYQLDNLFFTIATQNPIEMEGTYPLPSAQLDRFYMKISMGYVDAETELEIFKNYSTINTQLQHTQAVVSQDEILALRNQSEAVQVHQQIIVAVSNIINATRKHNQIPVGASTRSGISFIKCLKAYALIQHRNYVTEEDVRDLYTPILLHRLEFKGQANKQQILDEIAAVEINRLISSKLQ
jgi:MoxR-like ATPase